MSMLAIYLPTGSVVHRLPAGVKLGGLVAGCVALLLVRQPWQTAAAGVVLAALYALARIPWRTAWSQARPMLVFAAVLLVFQWVVVGWERAVVIVGGLVVAVLLAGLVTLTTRTVDLVDAIVWASRPLARVGVDPERVGLLLALGIRSVAVVADLAREVRQAQLARGGQRSAVAFVVPLVNRTLRHADRLADALVARGVDD
ncbi:conserved membrane hypothetical protein [Nostocoides japonicum T1-X7]|uniref:Cobalt transport protein n=2 Tax=Nostocoides japonicum TaxID=99481 RepID=A0A077LXU2_9MICO|nr:conserved membrane hypothetical protein [Tetrasphaera japonica T1-X7]